MPIKMRYYSEDKNKIAPELKKLKNKSYPDFINALIDLCDDPKALNMIKQYFGGPKGENLLDAKKTLLPASKLMPTQNEIDLDKSLKYGLTHPENIKNYFSKEVEIKTPIVTYNGSYIIDGHHRWSQIYIFNPKAKLVCINFEGDLSPIQVLKSTQGSIAADISKVPVSKVEGTSMYDVDEDTIRKYITSYISDGSVEELKKYVKSVKSKKDAIDYLVNNSMHLIANNTPIAHAPKRDFMPQTDQASGALKKLDKSTTVFSNNDKSMRFSYEEDEPEFTESEVTEAARMWAKDRGLPIQESIKLMKLAHFGSPDEYYKFESQFIENYGITRHDIGKIEPDYLNKLPSRKKWTEK